jgi:hypothetical protein
MIANVRNALTRKFGPLPAWAWLGLLAIVVYLFRRSRGTVAAPTETQDTTSSEADKTTPEPVVLQPGESVYNPATGQLVGTAPEQQPGSTPESTGPIVAGPGESIYDPATGAYYPAQPESADGVTDTPVSTATAKKKPNALQRAKAAVASGRVGPKNRQRLRHAGYSDAQIEYHRKRKTPLGTPASKKHPKPKTQHKPGKPVKRPGGHKPPRNRSSGSVSHPTPRGHAKTPAPSTHTSRPRAVKPAPKPAARARAAATRGPLIRQRPAPAHTTPRTVHPAAPPPRPAPRPAPHPAPKPRKRH